MQSIKSLELSAPAKLNLFLHVVGRRADGYHLLESVFVMVDLCDTIKLTARPDGDIRRTGDVIGAPEKDLCIKAANLLKSHTGCSFGADIDVIKRIPAGAGMGGGSSDAATTLMGLNALWDLRLSREELIALGAKLGADVPFFLLGTNAWVEGIGEKLTPLDLPEMQFDIIWPGVSQATVEIFFSSALDKGYKISQNVGLQRSAHCARLDEIGTQRPGNSCSFSKPRGQFAFGAKTSISSDRFRLCGFQSYLFRLRQGVRQTSGKMATFFSKKS